MPQKKPQIHRGSQTPPNFADASLSELIAIKELAEAKIEEKKESEIQRLREKWIDEAAALNLTPESILGLETAPTRAHQTSIYSPVGDESKEYRKGPHPAWLKDLLKKHHKRSVLELVDVGALKARRI